MVRTRIMWHLLKRNCSRKSSVLIFHSVDTFSFHATELKMIKILRVHTWICSRHYFEIFSNDNKFTVYVCKIKCTELPRMVPKVLLQIESIQNYTTRCTEGEVYDLKIPWVSLWCWTISKCYWKLIHWWLSSIYFWSAKNQLAQSKSTVTEIVHWCNNHSK